MSAKTFDFRPTVELLQVSARGSLKQNLPKAVRLWVILRSLYGDETDPLRVQLKKNFTYSDWNKQFFTQTDTYHKDYKIPIDHDPQCPCARTIRDWLFNSDTGLNEEEWEASFLNLYPMTAQDLDNLLSSGIITQVKLETRSLTTWLIFLRILGRKLTVKSAFFWISSISFIASLVSKLIPYENS